MKEISAPRVTVLMGVYNASSHLEAAIQSVLLQSFSDFEFLIIDDCSQDGSADLIKQIAQSDARIRIQLNRKNVGLGAVLRSGVEHARGELIARMDADDISLRHRIQRQVDFLDAHPDIDVVGSYALDVSSDGAPLRERRVPTTHESISRLVWTNPFLHPTVMFRKNSITKVGSYLPIRRRQDYELWFRCVAGGLKLANIPEPLLHYHFSEATLRRNHLASMWEQVKIGWRGCRSVNAPVHAYVATAFPLLEALMPNWLRLRMAAIKAMVDPRRKSASQVSH